MEEQATPIRQQFLDIKSQYPDCMLLFRLGDFYETFDEDALNASKILNIVLTKKAMGKGLEIPMAGIPYHALDDYLSRLINEGLKVAICEQVTKPGETKGLVQREVIRIVTRGTIVEPNMLESNNNNYLAALYLNEDKAGLSYIDITTSEFKVTELPLSRVTDELTRINPKEVLIAESQAEFFKDSLLNVTECLNLDFQFDRNEILLKEQFKVSSLEGFGLKNKKLAITSAGAIVKYLQKVQKQTLGELLGISYYSTDSYMAIDESTQKNLELFVSSIGENKTGTLLSILDKTQTPMGARLLHRWIGQPSLNASEIKYRQDLIESIFGNQTVRAKLKLILKDIPDIERLVSRINSNIVTPRELVSLKQGLLKISELRNLLTEIELFNEILPEPQTEITDLIEAALNDPADGILGEGDIIKLGYSSEFDKLIDISRNSKNYLINFENKEKEATGISKLRVGFNSVFGYYIEVPNGSKNLVPDTYIRKQTLVNVERFYTPELKEYEIQVLHSKDQISNLEHSLYRQLIQNLTPYINKLLTIASEIALIDVIRSLSEVAVNNGYVKPIITEEGSITITKGRHPIVENRLKAGAYVPNDTALNHQDNQIMIITGPNMAGKSTYMKQVALIVLMAQIGSFVPAESAEISIVDRIFTRIGAHEELSSGKSTFMVEMVETANILNNATEKSLLLLDEIGRGTSTYDGLSIAEAVVEYLHNSPNKNAFTLFATHYHEMVKMADTLPKVKNFNIAVSENNGEIVLLHKIVAGGTDKSYGIHVAKLAGLPNSVTLRASELLKKLEKTSDKHVDASTYQMPLFKEESPLLKELSTLELDEMSPISALNLLYELKKRSKEELA